MTTQLHSTLRTKLPSSESRQAGMKHIANQKLHMMSVRWTLQGSYRTSWAQNKPLVESAGPLQKYMWAQSKHAKEVNRCYTSMNQLVNQSIFIGDLNKETSVNLYNSSEVVKMMIRPYRKKGQTWQFAGVPFVLWTMIWWWWWWWNTDDKHDNDEDVCGNSSTSCHHLVPCRGCIDSGQ